MVVEPRGVGNLRIGGVQLLHRLLRDAERRGIHQIPAPERHVEHTAVGELAEVLQVAHQTLHLPRVFLPIVGDAGRAAHHERGAADDRHRGADAQRERQIAVDDQEEHRAEHAQQHREDAACARGHAHRACGVQFVEFALARGGELVDLFVAVGPLLERIAHLLEVEHGRMQARAGFGEQAQHALLRLAQVEFLMVRGERARLDHHGARLADLLAFGRLLREHAGEHGRIDAAHVDAAVGFGLARVDGDRAFGHERHDGRGHLPVLQVAAFAGEHTVQFRRRAGAHRRRFAPVFDLPGVLGGLDAACGADDRGHAQRRTAHGDHDPDDELDDGAPLLAFVPFALLARLVVKGELFGVAGAAAFHAHRV